MGLKIRFNGFPGSVLLAGLLCIGWWIGLGQEVQAATSDSSTRVARRAPPEFSASEVYQQGIEALGKGQWGRARTRFEQCLEVAERDKDLRMEATLLEHLAVVYQADRQPIKARARQDRACALWEKARAAHQEGQCRLQAGELHLEARDFQRAREHLTRAQVLARKAGDDALAAHALLGLGRAELQAERFDVARKQLEAALAALSGAQRYEEEATALSLLAQLDRREGQVLSAYEHDRRAAELDASRPELRLHLVEDCLLLGRAGEALLLSAHIEARKLEPLARTGLDLMTLVALSHQGAAESAGLAGLALIADFKAIPTREVGIPDLGAARSFMQEHASLSRVQRDSLAGIMLVLVAERTPLSEQALLRQLEVLLADLRQGLALNGEKSHTHQVAQP